MIIEQRIIFDQYKGYEKLYFIGRSANWTNIRGVFQSNIIDLKIYKEGSFEEENRADVWGIDDYDLSKESDIKLKELHQKGNLLLLIFKRQPIIYLLQPPLKERALRPSRK